MAIIPEGWGQANLVFSGLNAPRGAQVVFGFRNDADQVALACANDIHALALVATASICTSDITFNRVDVKLGPNDTGPSASSTGSSGVGANGTTSLGPNTAYLATKITSFGGRRGRGRMFWPGVYDAEVNDSGVINSGTVTQVQNALNTFRAGLITNDLPMFVLHNPSYTWTIFNGQPRRVYDDPVTAPVPYLVDAIVADDTISTQRNRLR